MRCTILCLFFITVPFYWVPKALMSHVYQKNLIVWTRQRHLNLWNLSGRLTFRYMRVVCYGFRNLFLHCLKKHLWETQVPNDQSRVHSGKVMPKIFGVGFKIMQCTGMQSTRCWHSKASDQGKNGVGLWPTRRKFSKPLGYLRRGVCAECTLVISALDSKSGCGIVQVSI